MSYVPPKYPGEIPTIGDLPDRVDDVDWLYAARYNELKKEIRAIMIELGTLPKGIHPDVKARLRATGRLLAFGGLQTIPFNMYLILQGMGGTPVDGYVAPRAGRVISVSIITMITGSAPGWTTRFYPYVETGSLGFYCSIDCSSDGFKRATNVRDSIGNDFVAGNLLQGYASFINPPIQGRVNTPIMLVEIVFN